LHGLLTPTLIGYRHIFRAVVEAGASVYAVELPYHLRRTPPGLVSGELFCTADFAMNFRALQQAVAEVRQLIHYLRAAGAPVIGLLGFSLGAWVSALVAGCEPEIDFALFGEPLRKQFESAGWSAAVTASFYHRLDPANLTFLIPPERRELFAAEFDHFIPLAYTQKLQRAWQHPHLRLYPSGHIGFLWSRKFLSDIRQIVSQQLALGRRQETAVTVVTEAELPTLPPGVTLHPAISTPQPRLGVRK
jgi:dienelactone hydrolase